MPGADVLVDLRPDEVLFPRSRVTVEVATPLEPESARRTIGVARATNAVEVARDGRRALWSPPDDLPAGRHVFQVGPLRSATGAALEPALEIPFTFVRSRARVPAGVAVGSVLRARVLEGELERLPVGHETGGEYVELVKATDRESGAPVSLAFDQSGKRVDATRLLRRLERAKSARLGKMDEALHRQLASGGARGRIAVAVWARTGADLEIGPDDKRPKGETRDTAAGRRRRAAVTAAARALAQRVAEAGGRDVRADDAAPVAFARLRPAEIRKLAERDDVAGVFLYEPEGIDDLGSSIAVANSDDVHAAGQRGTGVNVAVWEDGPTSTAELVIAAAFDSSPATSDHSQLVHAVIRNNQRNRPHGHAPASAVHSANSKDLDALRWAVRDRRCTVVNQSFHRPAEPESGSMSFDDVYKDWLAVTSPFPTIVQAAGNYWADDPDDIDPPSDEYVNHKGYNSLAVGNHNDSAGAMSSDSVFRNPTTTHGDRELPEVAANGTNVTAVGLMNSGTSFASPAAAGVAALLQGEDATLRSWPEGCRAILLAGATTNVAGDTWWRDVVDGDDAADGSGAVNALESHRIVGSRRGRNASPSRRGWDVGTLASGDFDANGLSRFAYRVQAPRFWLGPRHVKVALAWDGKVTTLSILGITFPLGSRLTVDLDLLVFDRTGAQVGYSGSWDNSYEIAEFDAVPGETYDIRIRRWAGTDWTWYGIAWTTTGSLLDLGVVLGSGVAEGLSRLDE